MIELKSLTFGYKDHPPIFLDFNWLIKSGEAWAVLGPSGGGKTTLLYILAGLLLPSRGEVRVDEQLIKRPRPQTGLILQEYGLLPWATVKQNAGLGMTVRSFYGPDGKHAPADFKPGKDVDAWLERLGIAEIKDKYPSQISGGQRQRTAIARTLTLRPDILLMDEPFSSLDAPTREGLQDLVLELKEEQNFTLVLVTHTIEEAAYVGKKILMLGKAPNSEAHIIENTGFGTPGYRASEEYSELIHDLRNRMEAG
jgi:NitT/TauT family transport system ATP-binding protein